MHVHFENDNFNIFELPLPQPRPQSPRSIHQRTIARERRQIRLAIEKRFHFLVPGNIFYVSFPIFSRALSKALRKSSVVEEESAIFPKDSRS